jgi:DNA-3-methyladenine glycosylase II
MSTNRLQSDSFASSCLQLGQQDPALGNILDKFGYPPMWTRPTGFATLIHIILEQQVSLASALAAYKKLEEKLGMITPTGLLSLNDEEMKACYFSRQKMGYARELANAVQSGQLNLEKLERYPDEEVKEQLIQVKGIGNWTAEIYLMMALGRPDVFPLGDLALVNSLKRVKQLPPQTEKAQLAAIGENWRPVRTVATMMLWHHYLEVRKKA